MGKTGKQEQYTYLADNAGLATGFFCAAETPPFETAPPSDALAPAPS